MDSPCLHSLHWKQQSGHKRGTVILSPSWAGRSFTNWGFTNVSDKTQHVWCCGIFPGLLSITRQVLHVFFPSNALPVKPPHSSIMNFLLYNLMCYSGILKQQNSQEPNCAPLKQVGILHLILSERGRTYASKSLKCSHDSSAGMFSETQPLALMVQCCCHFAGPSWSLSCPVPAVAHLFKTY